MRTIIHSTASATASSTAGSSSPFLAVARGVARPAHNGTFKLLKFTEQLFRQLLYAHCGCFHCFALTCLVSGQGAAPSSDFIVLIILFSLFSCQPSEMILVFFSFHSVCEIVHHGDACTFMLLIHQWQSLWKGLCVFFLFCVYFQFCSNTQLDLVRPSLRHWQKIAASHGWRPFTACLQVLAEVNPRAGNSCHYLWASSVPTVVASSDRGQAWTVIADTSRQLGHRVQIPWTPSPYHLPGELINPGGFFANMIH